MSLSAAVSVLSISAVDACAYTGAVSETAKTGDRSNMGIWLIVLIAAALALLIGYIAKKRKK